MGAGMKFLFVSTSVLLLMTAPMAQAGDAGVEATLRQFADAFNKGDMKAAKALHVAAPNITDEVAPYHWSGPKAFDDWGADLNKAEAAEGKSGGQATMGAPTRENISGTDAYVIVPATYTYKQKGVTMRETSQFTFAMTKEASGWKIAAWTWTGPEGKPVR